MMYAIKNWSRFQHYTKRHPPWIKLYHDLLDDADFAALDHFSQLLYFKLLMAASRKDNQIPADAAWMATELSLPKRRVQIGIEQLLSTGFLASTSASGRASNGASNHASENASPSRAPAQSRESETEIEKNKTQPTHRSELRSEQSAGGRDEESGFEPLDPAAALVALAANHDPA